MSRPAADMNPQPAHIEMTSLQRMMVIIGALVAIFLGALDALIVSTAMPTITADLGGLDYYSWVFSAYLLTRTISLPIFGKLADLYDTRRLFVVTAGLFVVASVLAGTAASMPWLIAARALQGIGAGGNFALAYTVVADISTDETRGRRTGLISLVWGLSSVLGPALGALIVSALSWPWIFYLNVPIGCAAIAVILVFMRDVRVKKADGRVDFLGAFALSTCVLSFLGAILFGSKGYGWFSPSAVGLFGLSLVFLGVFIAAELRAADPIFRPSFFRLPDFVFGNAAAFFAGFTIFSFIAFVPLFVQGALGKDTADVGLAIVPVSLGWSGGGFICGYLVNYLGERPSAVAGAILMTAAVGLSLTFTQETGLTIAAAVFGAVGLGMGFVFLSTLLSVQKSVRVEDLGAATSTRQFALNLGGTVGVGISGGIMMYVLEGSLRRAGGLSERLGSLISGHEDVSRRIRDVLDPTNGASLPPEMIEALRKATADGVRSVFEAALIASVATLLLCAAMLLKARSSAQRGKNGEEAAK